MRKRIVSNLVVSVGLALGLAVGAQAGIIVVGELSGAGSFYNPGVDIYGPKCPAPTVIRARLREDGGPDTHHVIVSCIAPANLVGKGDKELARSVNAGITPWRDPGEWAETPNGCTEALVIVGCEETELCEGSYIMEMECKGMLFNNPAGTPKFNR